jgi:hypothetical protein
MSYPSKDMRFCRNCGAVLETVRPTVLALKNRNTAVMLAALAGVLLMGLGHFYALRIKRGLLFMLLGLIIEILFFVAFFGAFFGESSILAMLFGFIWVGLWAMQIRDSASLVKTYNESLKATGQSPW